MFTFYIKEDSSDKDLVGGSQITTTAHVEINHHVSDGDVEVEEGEINAVIHKPEDSDSDMSPHSKHRIKKRRKAVRRAQSAAECREYLYRENPVENRSNNSLPQGIRLSEVKLNIDDDIASGSMFRPRSECIIRQKKTSTPHTEMTIVELESSPKHSRRDDILEKMDLDDNEKPKYRRSVSEDGVFMPFKPKAYEVPITSDLKPGSNENKVKVNDRTEESESSHENNKMKHKPTSSKQYSSCDVHIPKKDKMYKKKTRPNSAGDINKVSLEKKDSGKCSKPKDLPISHKHSKTVKDSDKDAASQRSSTVGLDWLFSTDSDSVSSGEGKVKGQMSAE